MTRAADVMQHEVDGLRGSAKGYATRAARERAHDARVAAADARTSQHFLERAGVEQARIDGLRRTISTCRDSDADGHEK